MHKVTPDTAVLLDQYVAAWNEADPGRRRAAVGRLYADDGRVITPSVEVRGRDAVVEHIGDVFAEFIGSSGRRFRGIDSARNHRGLLLRWELAGDGQAVATGTNALLLGPDGRIEIDHQFSEPSPDDGGAGR